MEFFIGFIIINVRLPVNSKNIVLDVGLKVIFRNSLRKTIYNYNLIPLKVLEKSFRCQGS